ncbi:MAG: hypothetical protein FJW86_12825 [Actinobacteria bacterium]|nr:hypothetical protein [Actinomycetota bacterium]
MTHASEPNSELLTPERLWTRDEVLARPSPVPNTAGVYAWWFKQVPPGIAVEPCRSHEGRTLLYIGISPRAPYQDGRVSSQHLRKRLQYHYRGNAAGSTLRLTLGCLLADELGIELRRTGSGQRMTFGTGEERLSQWMGASTAVSWFATSEPWIVEHELIATTYLPLNLDQNAAHPFHRTLSDLRARARATARQLPVI